MTEPAEQPVTIADRLSPETRNLLAEFGRQLQDAVTEPVQKAVTSGYIVSEQGPESVVPLDRGCLIPNRFAKATPPQRYLLGIAYQAGKDPRIAKGADGGRDYFTETELEKAAWEFGHGQRQVGLFHGPDNTVGHFQVTESYLYRGPDWPMTDVTGAQVVVKSGDWLIGGICDETAWDLYQTGRITGFSPQGQATRRTRSAA